LDQEAAAISTPFLWGVVYNFWLAAFTAGPSAEARIHLLYPES